MMKSIIKLFSICLVSCGLSAALTSCSSDDDTVQPASQEQLQNLHGHWYAEIPISGETANWRTEEEDDMTDYDHIGVLVYLNGTYTDASYWGYIFLQDNELVNIDGIFMRDNDEASFDYTMDSEGNITPMSHLADAPQVTNMHYDAKADIITANVAYKGHNLALTLVRPTQEEGTVLYDYWQMLAEAHIVGGYDDGGDHLNTDVKDESANKPSRARTFTTMDCTD